MTAERCASPSIRTRTAHEFAWFAAFALLAATVLGLLAVVAKVAVCVAGGYQELLPYVAGSWRTVAVLPLAVLLAAVWGRSPHGPSLRRLRRDSRRWAVGMALAAAVVAVRSPYLNVNAYGMNVSQANARFWIDERHPHRPPALVTTNAHGFRDRPWTPAPPPGVARVVVVGDSYVFGSGVPDAGGTLARSLESALGALRGGGGWEVLNAGYPGWGLLTYFDVARRLVRELRPSVVVIATIGWSDWDVLDDAQLFARLGPTAYRVLGALSVVADLRQASLLLSRDAVTRQTRGDAPPDAERFARALDTLLKEAEAAGVEVVVWEYYEPLPLLGTFDGRPRFRRAGWPPGFPREWDGWGSDPTLAIPVDRHPTAEGNRLVAAALAPVVAAAAGASGTCVAEGAAR